MKLIDSRICRTRYRVQIKTKESPGETRRIYSSYSSFCYSTVCVKKTLRAL